MSSNQDFSTVLVQDETLNLKDSLGYAVKIGGSSVNYAVYPAVSASNTSLNFSCQIPSESIVIDREVLIKSRQTYQITITNVPAVTGNNSGISFSYGWTDAFAPYPLSQCCNTLSIQLNNVNVSCNVNEVLPAILRLTDSREILKYNGMTPALPDNSFKFYGDSLGPQYAPQFNNGSLSGFDYTSYDNCLYPRGSHRLISSSITRNNVANNNLSTALNDTFVVTLEIETTEPIFCSPFIFACPEHNRQGMAGISQLNFTFNLDPSAKRALRTANDGTITAGAYANNYTHTVQLVSVTNAQILIRQLSSQPSQMIPAKNVVPYMSFDRYVTAANQNIPAPTNLNNGKLQRNSVFSSATLTSSNISLSSIPDYFVVYARKPWSQQTIKDSDSFLPIKSIQVQFNNVSGLLSTMTPELLYRMSVKNGSGQSWNEFSGLASINTTNVAGSANECGLGQFVRTTGSLLVIDPSYDLSLPNYVANGSVGQYNFQISCVCENNFNAALTPELVVICVQSGVMVNLSGTSAIYTGVLNKEICLTTASEQAQNYVSSAEHYRMVGGSMMNRIASAMKSMRSKSTPSVSTKKPFANTQKRTLDLLSE
jgi:hypothetical protein